MEVVSWMRKQLGNWVSYTVSCNCHSKPCNHGNHSAVKQLICFYSELNRLCVEFVRGHNISTPSFHIFMFRFLLIHMQDSPMSTAMNFHYNLHFSMVLNGLWNLTLGSAVNVIPCWASKACFTSFLLPLLPKNMPWVLLEFILNPLLSTQLCNSTKGWLQNIIQLGTIPARLI